MRSSRASIFIWAAGLLVFLLVVVALFEATNIDLRVQDRFYDFDRQEWIVSKDAALPKLIFYEAPKAAYVTFALVILGLVAKSFVMKERGDRRLVVVLLCMISVPVSVGMLKDATDVYFPSQAERYGGKEPYVKLFEAHPEIRKWTKNPRKPGHGFPAGHASGGFALMGLCVFGRTRRGITLGVAAGLSLGWILGSYQMLNGNHYLSHTVVTNLLAGILVLFWIGIMLRGGGTKRRNQRR